MTTPINTSNPVAPILITFEASTGTTEKVSTLFIGTPQILPIINAAVESCSLKGRVKVELDPSSLNLGQEIVYGRDARLVLPNEELLIPYMLKGSVLDLYYAYLPLSCKELMISESDCAGYGKGFSEEINRDSLLACSSMHLPFRQARSVLEGGNCLLFKGEDNHPRADIGYGSISLTLIALDEQGYFEENDKEIKEIQEAIEETPFDFFQMAKNFKVLKHIQRLFNEMSLASSLGQEGLCCAIPSKQHSRLIPS